jgi:proteasome accessory factor B
MARNKLVKISSRGVTRTSLVRIQKMHRVLKKGGYPNFRKFAEELDVSEKTVQRDMDLMRDQLDLPIKYSQTEFGFYYTEEVVDVPGLELTEGEIVSLFIARQALGQYAGTPFAASLKSACARLERELHNRVSLNLDELDTMLSFRSTGESPGEVEIFRLVNHAIVDCVELTFDYHKINGSAFEPRRVQPLHLACHENQWYLWAFDLVRVEMRTFSLSRLKDPALTRKKFRRPRNFAIEKHLEGSFGVFRGESDFRIRIWFDSFAARYVREKKWHHSQKLVPLKNGETELIVKLNSLQEISRWVLSWGKHARVLEPEALIEDLADVAHSFAEFYPKAEKTAV